MSRSRPFSSAWGLVSGRVASTNISLSTRAAYDNSRPLVDIHRRLVRVRQKGVDFVPCRIESDGMGALGSDNGLQELHGPGIKDINDPRVADGDVEMPKAGVQENDIGTATQGAFVQHAS